MPWVVIEDLNDVAFVFEKRGGGQFCYNKTQVFVECFSGCGLSDTSAIGSKFTWTWILHGGVVIRD